MDLVYIIAFALTFIFSFALGIFTILKNYKSKVHWLWFLTSMSVALWAFSSVSSNWFSTNKEWSLMYYILINTGALLVVMFYFHFVITFLNINKQFKILIIINYFIGLLFILLLNFTNLVVVGVEQKLNFKFWEKGGILFPYYAIYCFLIFIICLYLQIKGYKTSEGLRKKKLFYLLAAIIIGFGGGLTAFLPDLFNIYPFGTLVVFLYPLLITKGIFLEND